MENETKYSSAVDYIRSVVGAFSPKIGVVLGSGLGRFVDFVTIKHEIDYCDIPNFPLSTVEGHDGKLIFGEIDDRQIVVMKGRFHYYEGYSGTQTTFPIRVFKLLGVEVLMLSNASGGINPSYGVGDIVVINNHLNFIPNPLIGKNDSTFGVRFPEMKYPYSKRIIELAMSLYELKQGVYVGVTGPSMESAAEIAYFLTIGGDLVGMSTTPETIVARHCSMEVFAASVVTNSTSRETSHEEVVSQGDKASRRLSMLFRDVIKKL